MRVGLNGLEFNVGVEGDGPPLVLLHGFTGSAAAWDDVRGRLRDSSQVIAIDLIGHGQSDAPEDPARYSLEWCARDLGALLDALGVGRASVLGYSMGGRVALHFAATMPQRVDRLILESASPGIEDAAERERRVQSDNRLAERILADGIAAFVEEWERQPLLELQPHVADAVRQRQRSLRLANDPLGLANSLRGMGTGQQRPLWHQLPNLAMPVHVIVGGRDSRYVGIGQRMAALLPRASLAIVPAAGHTVHLDQPEAFLALLTDAFTNRVTPADFPLSTN